MKIRIGVQALIVKDGEVLVVVKEDQEGKIFILPGGGQEHGETLVEAVERECLEEIGARVQVDRLLTVRELISKNHPTSTEPTDVHIVNHIFTCTLLEEPRLNQVGDPDQVGVRWLPLEQLPHERFFPEHLALLLAERRQIPTYLGDVN